VFAGATGTIASCSFPRWTAAGYDVVGMTRTVVTDALDADAVEPEEGLLHDVLGVDHAAEHL
jgi:hypothetical protein